MNHRGDRPVVDAEPRVISIAVEVKVLPRGSM